MAWSYSASDLDTETDSGRINVVRFLVGDTDISDQQVQNEEITFSLGQTGNNVYYAGAFVANKIASTYARRSDTEVDGDLRVSYSQVYKHYKELATTLTSEGRRFSSGTLGLSYGGISNADIGAVRTDTDRVSPTFRRDRFRIDSSGYSED